MSHVGGNDAGMTRDELFEVIKKEAQDNILRLFEVKNQSYGVFDDAFHNFRETARRVFGDERYMFKVLLTLMDKHLVALVNNGVNDPEAASRLRDVCVYSLIGIAMLSEGAGVE